MSIQFTFRASVEADPVAHRRRVIVSDIESARPTNVLTLQQIRFRAGDDSLSNPHRSRQKGYRFGLRNFEVTDKKIKTDPVTNSARKFGFTRYVSLGCVAHCPVRACNRYVILHEIVKNASLSSCFLVRLYFLFFYCSKGLNCGIKRTFGNLLLVLLFRTRRENVRRCTHRKIHC